MTTVRPLPVRVPLVRTETLHSYMHRLASANHLDARDLRGALGMRTRTRPPDLDRLAVLTGHPGHLLADVLADARPPPGRDRLAPRTGRPACRRCTARRGITGDVLCVDVDYYVCRRHRRWLGGPLEQTGDQHDLTVLPEVLHAQRRHHRLLRRHGTDPARIAVYWATKIVDGWTARGTWREHRESRLARLPHGTDPQQPDGSVLHMVNYPEVVTLADLLASERWRTIASANYRRDRWPFDREVARRLDLVVIGFAPEDPLVSWEEGEALARRSWLHQQPGYRGPEVWLSLAGELDYELVPTTKWPS
jgi:hypothetical protein